MCQQWETIFDTDLFLMFQVLSFFKKIIFCEDNKLKMN